MPKLSATNFTANEKPKRIASTDKIFPLSIPLASLSYKLRIPATKIALSKLGLSNKNATDKLDNVELVALPGIHPKLMPYNYNQIKFFA